jgi:chorismate synthase
VSNSIKNSKINELSLYKLDNISCKTNNSGGTLGGISNGENIYFNVAFKPVSTIGLEQDTSDYKGKECKLLAKGRHDPCVLPRAMPIVEGMTAITLMDHCLIQASRLISKDKDCYWENEI